VVLDLTSDIKALKDGLRSVPPSSSKMQRRKNQSVAIANRWAKDVIKHDA
jgi:hypothetical protein